VYVPIEPDLWQVGIYDPSGKWHPESEHDSPEEASERVDYLNSGDAWTDD